MRKAAFLASAASIVNDSEIREIRDMANSAKHNGWKKDMKRRIGLSGELGFTQTAVGQTLHIPCSHGHVADFSIPPNSNPDFVAKKMLNSGWTIGRKLTCPKHQRKKKSPRAVKGGHARAASLTQERRSEIAKEAAAKRWSNHQPKPIEETKEEKPTMSEEKAEQSPAAKRAFRYLMMELEDSYNDATQSYAPGKSDKSIAAELKISEEFVIKTREEHFGPLGMPSELIDLRKEISVAQSRAAADMASHQTLLEKIERRLDAICHKNGWPVA